MRWGFLHANVADAVVPPRIERKEVQLPSVEEVWRILDIAKPTPYHHPPLFIARTGVRRGECLGIRWRDIDLDIATASIAQSLQRVRRQGLVFLPPKSDKSRRAIALDTETVDTLRQLQGAQILLKAELGNVYHDNGLVFPWVFR